MKIFRFLTIISAFIIFCTFLIPIGSIGLIITEKDAHFSFNKYKKVKINIDTIEIYDGSKGAIRFIGKKKSHKNFKIIAFGLWGDGNPKNYERISAAFQANNHKLWIFFKDYESPAYFVEDEFQEMSFKTIWLPVLRNLGIFILIVLNFFFWRHKYHQAILATGMSLDEYSRLQESKRPKRKSLSEEYEEIMKRENEKKNQP
jgi:hypothetical protein